MNNTFILKSLDFVLDSDSSKKSTSGRSDVQMESAVEPSLRASGRASGRHSALFLALLLLSTIALLGCSGSVRAAEANPLVPPTNNVNLGSVSVGHAASTTLSFVNKDVSAISITQVNVVGNSFALTSPQELPTLVAAGSSYNLGISFSPATAGSASGQLSITANSGTGPATSVVNLRGTGTTTATSAVPSAISCITTSLAGASTDNCTVTLSAAAPSDGLVVTLSSNNSAVMVPASVTVAANATSAGFAATVAAVTSTQSAVLTATALGTSQTISLQLNAVAPALTLSKTSISFGSVWVGRSGTQSLTLTSTGNAPLVISSASISGTGMTLQGAAFPATLNPGQAMTLQTQFSPAALGTITGQLVLNTNTTKGTMSIGLTGTGVPPPAALSALSCASSSLTGAATDTCTVSLTWPAASGGFAVGLSSTSTALTLPATVTVPANATSATFTASAASVTSAQAVTITASAGSVSKTYMVVLNVAGAKLSADVTSVSFGNVWVGRQAVESLTLTSGGASALTITSASVSGAGFTLSPTAFPITLNPGQSTTLQMQFAPTALGATTGQLTIASNSVTGATITFALTGTGMQAPATLSALSCASSSVIGTATDVCTVTLTSAASSSGFAVTLSSNNALVTVPATLTVPANATSATFTASAASTTSTQTATLTASAAGISKTFALKLNAAILSLAVDTTSVSFGNVLVNMPATQPVTLSSAGTMPVTVSSATVTGTGFSLPAASFPITLSPGQSTLLSVQFSPTQSGAVSGTLTIVSDSTSGNTTPIALTATALPASIFANIDIDSTPGQAISPTFLGLSHEWVSAQSMMGDSTTGVDDIYRQLVRNLTAYGSGPIILRIGGNSTDTSGEPTAATMRPFAELANAMGARFYLGVNLGYNNVNLAVDQAKAFVSQMPQGSISGLEIGNEPDAYAATGKRTADYAYPQYLADFNTWKNNLMPVLPAGITLMGPSWGGAGTAWLINAQAFDSTEAGALGTFSHHYYAGTGTVSNPDDFLLTPTAATSGPSRLATAIATAHQYGVPLRIGELNSLNHGGVNGISNTFQSALWAVDTMFEYANVGADGVNWHGVADGIAFYNPFQIAASTAGQTTTYRLVAVNPIYYGYLFFQAATGNNAHMLHVTLSTQANLKAWATIDSNATQRLVVINKDETNTGIVNVAMDGYTHAQIFRLSAPDYQSMSGVTFAGQTFDGSADGTIQGTQTIESASTSNGAFQIPMPTASAALVVFSK